MALNKDFTVSAENVKPVQYHELTALIPGKRFRTPDKFYEKTLMVFLNGVRVEEDNDDGFVVIDDETFEMNQVWLPDTRFRVSCHYVKQAWF